MSPPIMSRFDLFFVILDECHEQTDFAIAQHIINFHRFKEDGIVPDYSTEQLKLYLTYARGLKPQMTEEAREYLVIQYRNLRQADATGTLILKFRCQPIIIQNHSQTVGEYGEAIRGVG